MKNTFLILGYGIPKNILKDENYNLYLKIVFNKIYNLVVKNKIKNPLIICSGGKTDMFKPYQRTEAEEMIKFLKKLSQQSFLKTIAKDWVFVPEKKALSTLENFLNCQVIIKKKKIQASNLFIFCEQTREKRIKTLSKKIFNKNYKTKIIAVDFDTSPNRYLDPNFLKKKETTELKYSLWALKNPKNLEEHHQLFQDKINYLRKADPSIHSEEVKKWWEKKLKEIDKTL